MNIHNASIKVSAVSPKQYPTDNLPEIAFAGRSNVGKSSFINKMLNRRGLARTSATPGKTAQINFYNIDDTIYFVDLPGYGYAAVSKQEKKRWGDMMEEYLNTRENLKQTFLLVDMRHKPTADDVQMAEWIRYNFGSLIVIATKLDKLKKSQIEGNIEVIKKTLGLTDEDILVPFSAEKGNGRDEAWEVINAVISVDEE
ncbi:MAG: YihA family ribosome biogenesis GTP-binding protein [Clostridia bacterium]|nr:YihA family ribosome biogenesis GTP-binding protein [Clostridia bacterium]